MLAILVPLGKCFGLALRVFIGFLYSGSVLLLCFCFLQEIFMLYFVSSSTNVVTTLFGSLVSSNFLVEDGG